MRSAFLALLVACSSNTHEPKKPNGSNAPPADAATSVAPGPSERECTDLFAHAIELHVAEVKKTKPAQAPTAPEIEKLEAELREQFLAGCRASTMDGHRCARAATTLDALATCQATPSSSTSNSSVAPGGMTPAAPRSP